MPPVQHLSHAISACKCRALHAGDLLTKMSPDQRACLSGGPTIRAFVLKTELLPPATIHARAQRFYTAMQGVAPPSPAILMPLFILLCQQMTLLVKSLEGEGVGRASTVTVFSVRSLALPCCAVLPR